MPFPAPHRGVKLGLASAAGTLDLGPWQRVIYGEWDGQQRKHVSVKVLGEREP
jgi:thiamine phosphate synthase YjbQ (UPF0047 family)